MRELAGVRVALVAGLSEGGTGRHIAMLARALVESGGDVTVAAPASVLERFEIDSTGARPVPMAISARPSPTHDMRTMSRLRRLSGPVHLMHAHGLRAAALAALAGTPGPGRTPLVVSLHNAAPTGGRTRAVYSVLERLVARRADVVLGVSPDLVDRARSLGARDVRLAPVSAPPLAAPIRDRDQVRADLAAGERPLALSVGRLDAQKGYRWLVEAAAMLGDRQPQPLFVVAGEGPDRPALQRLIDIHHAPVRLLGHRADVSDLLAAADLVVSSSVWEGSPLSAQEALRAGRPFIGTRVGGVPALVGDGALLVPPRDAGALAAAIRSVLDDPALATDLSGRAVAAAAGLPTDASVAADAVDVYTTLLHR
ncbi:MAG: glycosyltransferase [Nocardioidaceae bacterium]